ncbi:hypothetical protein ACMC56_16730 (plasmid) [Campylobacterota bacterium DY0563]
MRILVLWSGRVSKNTHRIIFEYLVSLAYESRTHIRLLKGGTLESLDRMRFLWLDVEGNVDRFLERVRENYTVYREVR